LEPSPALNGWHDVFKVGLGNIYDGTYFIQTNLWTETLFFSMVDNFIEKYSTKTIWTFEDIKCMIFDIRRFSAHRSNTGRSFIYAIENDVYRYCDNFESGVTLTQITADRIVRKFYDDLHTKNSNNYVLKTLHMGVVKNHMDKLLSSYLANSGISDAMIDLCKSRLYIGHAPVSCEYCVMNVTAPLFHIDRFFLWLLYFLRDDDEYSLKILHTNCEILENHPSASSPYNQCGSYSN